MLFRCFPPFSPNFTLHTLLWWPSTLHFTLVCVDALQYIPCIDHYSTKSILGSLLISHRLPNPPPPAFPYILVMLPWLTTMVAILLLFTMTTLPAPPIPISHQSYTPINYVLKYLSNLPPSFFPHCHYSLVDILCLPWTISTASHISTLISPNLPFHPPCLTAIVYFLKGESDHATVFFKCL